MQHCQLLYEEVQTGRVLPAGLTHPTCQFLRMCGEDRFHQQHRPLADPGGTVKGCHSQSVEMFHLKETTNLVVGLDDCGRIMMMIVLNDAEIPTIKNDYFLI